MKKSVENGIFFGIILLLQIDWIKVHSIFPKQTPIKFSTVKMKKISLSEPFMEIILKKGAILESLMIGTFVEFKLNKGSF